MSARTKRSLKSKLLGITATIMLLSTVVTLTSVAWVNYATENDRLADIEHHIRQIIWSKGATLTESHALALKSLVADNAFSDVQSLVERAAGQDEDVLYGAFIGTDDTAWVYVSPTNRFTEPLAKPPTKDGWRELGIANEALHAPYLEHRKTS